VSFTSLSNPSLATSVPTSSSPALATRFGSSKVTTSRSNLRETRLTESASCAVDYDDLRDRHRPSSRGTFREWASPSDGVHRWIEA
jgi:hypothetical protein